MGNFRGWEWILVLALALLLFGGFKKMPDAARGIGRSLRIFKAETKGLVDHDDEKTGGSDSTAVAPAAPPVAPPAAAGQQDATNSTGPA